MSANLTGSRITEETNFWHVWGWGKGKEGHLDWLKVGRCILLLGTCRLHHSMVWVARLDEKEADKVGVYNIHLCFLTVDTR